MKANCDYCGNRVEKNTLIERGNLKLRLACPECMVTLRARDIRFEALANLFEAPEVDLKRRRGPHHITEGQYETMVEAQGSACAICHRIRSLHVDHDHTCDCPGPGGCPKCIRGLLCSDCNTSLGKFGDTLEGLLRAVEYLQSPRPLA